MSSRGGGKPSLGTVFSPFPHQLACQLSRGHGQMIGLTPGSGEGVKVPFGYLVAGSQANYLATPFALLAGWLMRGVGENYPTDGFLPSVPGTAELRIQSWAGGGGAFPPLTAFSSSMPADCVISLTTS